MELINWGLSAIDTIFSSNKASSGDADSHCPSSSYPAGFVKDSYGKWQPLCLFPLSVEDSEDLIIFWSQVAGTLLLGLAAGLVYRKIIKKMAGNQQNVQRLPDMMAEIGRVVQLMSARLELIAARLANP